jgi:hypothetical protein
MQGFSRSAGVIQGTKVQTKLRSTQLPIRLLPLPIQIYIDAANKIVLNASTSLLMSVDAVFLNNSYSAETT